MFAFTSTGGEVDNSVNTGGGPYVYSVNAVNHHRIGNLLPAEGRNPKFLQLYIYDTDHEISNRMCVMSSGNRRNDLQQLIVDRLLQMLNAHNPLVKVFRMTRDTFRETEIRPVRIRLIGTRKTDDRQYNLPTSSEVAAINIGEGTDQQFGVPAVISPWRGFFGEVNTDKEVAPIGYNAVVQYMMHGPYGSHNLNAPCMDQSKCTKHYLKPFRAQTMISDDGYPAYRRRDDKIFMFDIQFRDPSVERLPFHLSSQHTVIFNDDDDSIEDVVNREGVEKTMFTEWMQANKQFAKARNLTYAEFPTKFVWKQEKKMWQIRKFGRCIGRLYYAHPTSGERYYLRMLLNIVRGPTCYEDIITVDGVLYPTFKEACHALLLLDNDDEWHEALKEASHSAFGYLYRHIFVSMILFCEVTDHYNLWIKNWEILSEDVLYRIRRSASCPDLQLTPEQLQNHALYEIEKIMNGTGRSLREFSTLPMRDLDSITVTRNSLIMDELAYDRNLLTNEHAQLYSGLNVDQRATYDAILDVVRSDSGEFFFVYGSGGTSKTNMWRTIISKLRSKGQIVLAVASSVVLGGDFTQILPVIPRGGRTDIVGASISESPLWDHYLRDGKLPRKSFSRDEEPEWKKVPDDIILSQDEDLIAQIVSWTYPDCIAYYRETKRYLSFDKVALDSGYMDEQSTPPTELLNTLKFSGIPNHELVLKVGVPVILLRNVNQAEGLCNGTRLIITKLGTRIVEAEIVTRNNIGKKVLIHHIVMSPTDSKWPFTLLRRQFPLKLCFAMTINKSKGQTFNHVEVYLPKPVFSHGQLYVAVSRVTSKEDLEILVAESENGHLGYTKNIVYHELFNKLP
ncbi:DNA helicase PIF1, ATP-dependent [Corchorus olitorius]|uniref:ATP-dependent DNA helicase n=1 Tax=Corchorus olitorius TaxID=93759 RepID=A0A1R3L4I4_9ROSI|nr:DNA helicase PIF1, ATP-dependent [Corchorus olitorius]